MNNIVAIMGILSFIVFYIITTKPEKMDHPKIVAGLALIFFYIGFILLILATQITP